MKRRARKNTLLNNSLKDLPNKKQKSKIYFVPYHSEEIENIYDRSFDMQKMV